ncbi:hypothetical protein [Pedobacter lusitanus]|nr:hypothetical protein [Pedobacter lusitanus]
MRVSTIFYCALRRHCGMPEPVAKLTKTDIDDLDRDYDGQITDLT